MSSSCSHLEAYCRPVYSHDASCVLMSEQIEKAKPGVGGCVSALLVASIHVAAAQDSGWCSSQ
jgi:hypothetical protein